MSLCSQAHAQQSKKGTLGPSWRICLEAEERQLRKLAINAQVESDIDQSAAERQRSGGMEGGKQLDSTYPSICHRALPVDALTLTGSSGPAAGKPQIQSKSSYSDLFFT